MKPGELDYQTAAATVPPLSAGTPTLAPVEQRNPPGEVPRLPSQPDATKKSVAASGGNRGGRPRNDGKVPGSVEAAEADREKDKKRKQADRAAQREALAASSALLPPPLPPAQSGVSTGPTVSPDGNSVAIPEALAWVAADFNFVVADVISLAETARIKSRTKRALDKGLPADVAKKMGADFAFPVETKNSLRASSPQGLADLFNRFRVPVSLKPAISACPALFYLIVRDIQLAEAQDKVIADWVADLKREEERRRQPAAA